MKIQRPNAGVEDRYPPSLRFLSEKLCLIADGCGGILIVETGDREKNDEFKGKYKACPLEIKGHAGGFVILDARFDIVSEVKKINCILAFVQQNEQNFEMVVHWMALKMTDNKVWEVEASKVIKSRGAFSYCALEHRSNALLVASDYPVDFLTKILENKEKRRKRGNFVEKSDDQDTTSKADTEMMEKDIPDTPEYSWVQTDEDVTINFNSKDGANRSDYIVQVRPNDISVKFKGEILLEGQLYASIDPDTTTWTIQNNFLQVLINKENSVTWPFLVPGSPEEQIDGTKANSNDPQSNPEPVSTLASQMEECDYGIGADKENYLSRLVWNNEDTSHQVYLGSNPPLFEVNIRSGFPNAVAFKHDVDALIWIQKPYTESGEWAMMHEETIDALSYVQASKQQRKYTACAPDCSYVVICEPERHVFIYKRTYEGAANLRNRSGSPINIGQQKLVALENTGEVIGISVEKDVTILLTTKNILCLQLRIEE